jgi:hypothetical protein
MAFALIFLYSFAGAFVVGLCGKPAKDLKVALFVLFFWPLVLAGALGIAVKEWAEK